MNDKKTQADVVSPIKDEVAVDLTRHSPHRWSGNVSYPPVRVACEYVVEETPLPELVITEEFYYREDWFWARQSTWTVTVDTEEMAMEDGLTVEDFVIEQHESDPVGMVREAHRYYQIIANLPAEERPTRDDMEFYRNE